MRETEITVTSTQNLHTFPHPFLTCTSFQHVTRFRGANHNQLSKIQGDQKVSVHLMITVQKITRKNILSSFDHLP
jgi:hypothetical protein